MISRFSPISICPFTSKSKAVSKNNNSNKKNKRIKLKEKVQQTHLGKDREVLSGRTVQPCLEPGTGGDSSCFSPGFEPTVSTTSAWLSSPTGWGRKRPGVKGRRQRTYFRSLHASDLRMPLYGAVTPGQRRRVRPQSSEPERGGLLILNGCKRH